MRASLRLGVCVLCGMAVACQGQEVGTADATAADAANATPTESSVDAPSGGGDATVGAATTADSAAQGTGDGEEDSDATDLGDAIEATDGSIADGEGGQCEWDASGPGAARCCMTQGDCFGPTSCCVRSVCLYCGPH